MWLAMLGLYGYEGINSIPPELILLPRWLPVHPEQLYCHTRYVYLGVSYLFARRFTADLGPLAAALREELYPGPYDGIDFAAARGRVAGPDVHMPPRRPLRLAYDVLSRYERRPLRAARAAALRRVAASIGAELAASNGQGISPVSALLGCLVLADAGSPGDVVRSTLAAVDAWRWEDEQEGIRVAGARSAAWDTAFTIRGLLSGPSSPELAAALGRGYRWLCGAQANEELAAAHRRGRAAIKGGWCFSDGTHRWPVSDCTAEALSAILALHRRPDLHALIGDRIPDARLFHAVRFVLARQNRDGGFGTYERMRAPRAVELLNPSEMYADCMTERSHPECSASCVTALATFRAVHPAHERRRIDAAIGRGVRFLRRCQRPDGSYPGSWGINFTYATFFVVEALIAAGVERGDPAIAGAAAWLVAHQKDDGGWGEHYTSCSAGRYVEHPVSQAAMTAWALLALVRAVGPDHPAVTRAAQRLASMKQRSPGTGWPRQAGSGVFFVTAVLDYRLYKDIFPAWALARFVTEKEHSATRRREQ
jgi:lanosterol synthase